MRASRSRATVATAPHAVSDAAETDDGEADQGAGGEEAVSGWENAPTTEVAAAAAPSGTRKGSKRGGAFDAVPGPGAMKKRKPAAGSGSTPAVAPAAAAAAAGAAAAGQAGAGDAAVRGKSPDGNTNTDEDISEPGLSHGEEKEEEEEMEDVGTEAAVSRQKLARRARAQPRAAKAPTRGSSRARTAVTYAEQDEDDEVTRCRVEQSNLLDEE